MGFFTRETLCFIFVLFVSSWAKGGGEEEGAPGLASFSHQDHDLILVSESLLTGQLIDQNLTAPNNNETQKMNATFTINLSEVNETLNEFGTLVKDFFQDLNKTTSAEDPDDEFGLSSTIAQLKLLTETFKKAEKIWTKRQDKIKSIWTNKTGADSKSPTGTYFAFNKPNAAAIALSNSSTLLEVATRTYLKSLEKSISEVHREKRQVKGEPNRFLNLHHNDISKFDISPFIRNLQSPLRCDLTEEKLPCDTSTPYRSHSGWCNNIKNPSWGKSVSTFDRMINPAYGDHVSLPRTKSVNGALLPSPRYISSKIHVDVSHLSNKHTLMFMQYAQFLDHDMTHTPVHRGPGGEILNCKECDSGRSQHPECWPINVPVGDSYYPTINQTNGHSYCIGFTRSLPGQQRLGPREQINQNTAFIDSSQIYGETICKANTLRAAHGKLNVTLHPTFIGKPLMPQIAHLKECKSPSGYCFYAGDPRASEHPALAVIHTVFLREHNRLADELHRVNPNWDDERIYQQSKRILSAVNQHIAYNEFLPRLLGPTMINSYGLGLQQEGHYSGYDPYCSPAAFNEFAAAAFRFGHSLIRPQLARMDNRYHGMSPHIQLRDAFFNSDMLYKPLMVDEIGRGLLAEPMEQLDPFVTNEITNHLFEDKKKAFSGLDLISINIHRARDHGIPSYNEYRAVCSLKKATSFEDLNSEIPQEVINRLKHVYNSQDDIDLFTGALVERPVPGGLVGPTIACIIGSQFKRLRQCDRFWYETSDPVIRFTDQQLAEIRKTTLSKLLCENFDVPAEIQKSAFDAPHNQLNPRLPCDRLAKINVEAWREIPSKPVASKPSYSSCTIGTRQYTVGGAALPSPCVSCICSPEGTKCASLRITSCQRLMKEAKREDIFADKVCMSQCGVFMGDPQSNLVSGRSQRFN